MCASCVSCLFFIRLLVLLASLDRRRLELLRAREELLPNVLLHGLVVDSLGAHSVSLAKDRVLLRVLAQRIDLKAVEASHPPS